MNRRRAADCLLVLIVSFSALTALARPGGSTGQRRSSASPHRASITEALDCSACHAQTSWDVSSATASQSGFDHAKTGFPLTGRHRVADCSDCHRAERAITRQCAGCHEDPHRRTLGQGCDRCHSAVSWLSVDAVAIHRFTRLPLTGRHLLAACSECHLRASDDLWSGVPADCYACHAGDYLRSDIHPLHRGVPGDPSKPALPKNCAGCHRTTSFSPASAPGTFRFRAGLATTRAALERPRHDSVFPLSFGKHRGAACADCHLSEEAPRAVFCTGCHVHAPARLAKQHPTIGRVVSGCLHCHPGGARR